MPANLIQTFIALFCIFAYACSAPATTTATSLFLKPVDGSSIPIKITPLAQRKPDSSSGGVTVSAVSSTSSNMRNHGGRLILDTPTIYVILYGSFTTHAQATLKNFLLGFTNSPRLRIVREYTTKVNNVLKAPTGSYNLYSPFYFVDTSTRGTNLVETDLPKIIEDAIKVTPVAPNTAKLPLDAKGIYVVVTASNVNLNGFCKTYCGYHSFGTIAATNDIVYIFIGDVTRCPGSCAAQLRASPNNNVGLDASIDVLSHEITEVITDPYFDGYFQDSNGGEIADLCAYNYGTTFSLSPFNALYNMVLASAQYLTQSLWSNVARKCVLNAQVV